MRLLPSHSRMLVMLLTAGTLAPQLPAQDTRFGRAQKYANSYEARQESRRRNAPSIPSFRPVVIGGSGAGYQAAGSKSRAPKPVPAAEPVDPHFEAKEMRKRFPKFQNATVPAVALLVEDRTPAGESRALKTLIESADAGDPIAADLIARASYYGTYDSLPVDDARAAKYARIGADSGLGPSQFILGKLTLFGSGVPKDLARAVALLKQASTANPPEEQAVLDLAALRADGRDGRPGNVDEAIALLVPLAGKSDAVKVLLGQFRFNSEAPRLSEGNQQAFALIQEAADHGHPKGLYQAGLYRLKGLGVEADTAKGTASIMAAAEKGSWEAMITLGNLYGGENRHLGFTKDLAKSKAWFKRAADQGSAEAMHLLSEVEEDPARKADLVRQAALRGHSRARVGHALNRVRSKDSAEAKAGLADLVSLGEDNVEALRLAGEVTAYGAAGVPAQPAEGVALIRKAALAGDGEAAFRLSHYYEHGQLGLAQNVDESVKWKVKAADAGHAQAAFTAAWVHIKGLHGFPEDLAKANGYLRTAGPKMPFAKHILATHYYKGMGVEKDTARAFELWKEAARAGEETAQSILKQNNLTW